MSEANGQNGQNGSPNGHGYNAEAGELGGVAPLERRDLRNLEGLIRSGRWTPPPEMGKALAYELYDKAMGKHGESERHRLMAARCLIAMVGQNQADEHLAIRMAAGGALGDDTRIEVAYEEWPVLPAGGDEC